LGNHIIRDPVTGLERVFIPSKVDNNQYIDVEAYKQRLRASGSKELVRAWLDGDWSVTMGAFFDCWDTKRHVIPPFAIPKDWLRFRSGDWGSASPFSFGWWAIVQDNYRVDGRVLPRGCMVRYREWYGMRPGEPNVGLKLHAEEVGKGILEREQGETISYGVLDPSAFKEDGGPSIAERIARGSGGKVWFRHADNTRIPARGAMAGWDQMRSRLVGDGDGRPMIVTFSTCDDRQRGPHRGRVALRLHVAALCADDRAAEAGKGQRLPALSGRRAAGRLANVLAGGSKPDDDGVQGCEPGPRNSDIDFTL
jgi:hypothetical protein